jgi:phosphoribosylanthranilate isomerase
MSISVKICGITGEEALEAAIGAGADYAGFVFFERSPRNLTLERAAKLAGRAKGRIATVALTVNASDDAIEAIVAAMHPDFLQLHGNESVDRVKRLRSLTKIPIMKAIRVAAPEDIAAAREYEAAADILLFDAAVSAPGALPGGNGIPFDWRWLPEASLRPDFMLSGGLNSGNVLEALRASGALAVDVSSGVETAPGVKSPELIEQFAAIAKSFKPAAPAKSAAL